MRNTTSRSAIIILALFAMGILGAAPQAAISVDYLRGKAELRVGDAWKAIGIGDLIPGPSALVRLGKSSILEVSSAGRKISIAAEGNYDLSRLLATAPARSRPEALTRVGEILKGRREASAAMGVRGEVPPLMLSGFYEEAQDRLLEGNEAILDGDLSTAATRIDEAIELYSWTDGEEPALAARIAFSSAFVSASQDRSAEALAALSAQSWEGTPALAGTWTILEASLLIKAYAPARARDLCASVLARDASPEGGKFLTDEERETLKAIMNQAQEALSPA